MPDTDAILADNIDTIPTDNTTGESSSSNTDMTHAASSCNNIDVAILSTARRKQPLDLQKQWRGLLKHGCQTSFSVKTLYLLLHIAKIRILEDEYVNQNGEICHGYQHLGDRGAFTWQLLKDLKDFVLKSLRDGHNVPQIMTKHIDIIEETVKSGKEVNRDMFLHERDVRNLAIKAARETYMLDKNDASSIKLWVQKTSTVCSTM